MTDPTTPATTTASTNPFTLTNAKKAYGAGVAGLIAAEGAVIGPVLADGEVSASEVGLLIATGVGAFVVAFFGAWLPAQPASK